MKILCATACVLLAAAAAPAQSLQDCYNGIGLFRAPPPVDPEQVPWLVDHSGNAGGYFAYVTLLNPWNEHAGRPIDRVGGFELRIAWSRFLNASGEAPSGITTTAEGDADDCWNEFVVTGADLPVVGGQCLLMTLFWGTFSPDPALGRLRPVQALGTPSITGEIAVVDAADGTASRATPVFMHYDVPVFMYNATPVTAAAPDDGDWGACWNAVSLPAERHAWGDVKALYR